MRILALDHNFGQDLEALGSVLEPDDELRVISFHYLRDPFLRLFPIEVLSTEFSLFESPEHEPARRQWREWCRRELAFIRRFFPFDLLVLPSDTFPYVRDVVTLLQERELPVVVVQKETTIAPDTMEHHSRDIGRHFPFIGDRMTVCSEHHKDFWVRAGADPDRIIVTGQPRFDCYAARGSNGGRDPGRQRRVLFLTFMTDAYVPTRLRDRHSWRDLLSGIEEVLHRVGRAKGAEVLVKPHPQHPEPQLEAMRGRFRELDPQGRVLRVLERDLDTRELIFDADVVVGFQTTALMEGLLARKPTIYAAWGEALPSVEKGLIPYWEFGEPMRCARSAGELERILGAELDREEPPERVPEEVQRLLGPRDGEASSRVVRILRDLARCDATEGVRAADIGARLLRTLRDLATSLASTLWAALPVAVAPMLPKQARRRRRRIFRRARHQTLALASLLYRPSLDEDRFQVLFGPRR